jgi:hypothetical protein
VKRIACVLTLCLCLSAFAGLHAQEDPTPTPAPKVEAVLYEVYVYDGPLAVAHRHGHWIRELHVPSKKLAFNLENGTTNVFATDGARYSILGKTLEFELTPKDRAPAKKIKVPLLTGSSGLEPPARRIRSVRLPAQVVARLERVVALERELKKDLHTELRR